MRRHYVQVNGELIEISPDYIQGPNRLKGDSSLWNDRQYQDVGDPRFSSRTQHREYMKRNGLSTVDDYKDTWKNDEKKRVAVKHGFDPSRKQDIADSIDRLTYGRR